MTRPVVVGGLALLAILALVVVAADVVLRPQAGPLALAATLEEHLLVVGVLAAVVAAALSFGQGPWGARLRLLAVVLIVVGLLRLGDEWWSPAPASAASDGSTLLTVLSWNLENGSKAPATTVDGIREIDADLVALQELTPDAAAAIEADDSLTTRFPYRVLEPHAGAEGMGLLSRWPLVREPSLDAPPVLSAGLLLPDGRRVEVLDVHPFPPSIARLGPLPAGLDAQRRDDDLAVIRSLADVARDPRSVIVAGDLNTTPSEPGYRILASNGLTDAHEAAGTGPGFTWRPSSLEWLGVGLLRIDHVLTGAALRATGTREDCSIRGDHCRLIVDLAVEPPKPAT